MNLLSDIVLQGLLRTDTNGKVLQKENDEIEYKLLFDRENKEAKAKYAKELAALYNYKGGYLIFGVNDDTSELTGLQNFVDLDNADLSNDINNYFSPSIKFHSRTIEIDGKTVFVINVEKRDSIPTVCIKSYPQIISESVIYWRYSGQASPIKSGDLINLLNELKGQNFERIAVVNEKQLQHDEMKFKLEVKPSIQWDHGTSNFSGGTIFIKNSGKNAKITDLNILEGDVTFRFESLPYMFKAGAQLAIQIRGNRDVTFNRTPYVLEIKYEDEIGTKYTITGKFSGTAGKFSEAVEVK